MIQNRTTKYDTIIENKIDVQGYNMKLFMRLSVYELKLKNEEMVLEQVSKLVTYIVKDT